MLRYFKLTVVGSVSMEQVQLTFFLPRLLSTPEQKLKYVALTLVSGSRGRGLSPGRGHCVVFLGKTLNSHSASLHPGVKMGTGEFNAGGNPAMD